MLPKCDACSHSCTNVVVGMLPWHFCSNVCEKRLPEVKQRVVSHTSIPLPNTSSTPSSNRTYSLPQNDDAVMTDAAPLIPSASTPLPFALTSLPSATATTNQRQVYHTREEIWNAASASYAAQVTKLKAGSAAPQSARTDRRSLARALQGIGAAYHATLTGDCRSWQAAST